MHVNLPRKSNAGSQLRSRPCTGFLFPFRRGESPRGLDTDLYGETNEKVSWGPHFLWPTRRFQVNPGEVGKSERCRRFSLWFQCKSGSTWVLHRPIETLIGGSIPLRASNFQVTLHSLIFDLNSLHSPFHSARLPVSIRAAPRALRAIESRVPTLGGTL